MSVTKKTDAASGKKRWKPWQKNLIFALVVLAVAAALYFGWRAARGSKGTGLEAVVDFGSGASETLSLDEDHDYLYDVGIDCFCQFLYNLKLDIFECWTDKTSNLKTL